MASIYDYRLPTPKGEEVSLKEFQGKVLLIVNTATGCGFTPHYKALEELYEEFHDRGLEIIDVPCNQFGHQTPGSDSEISEFCTLNYQTQFPHYKKSDVDGEHELPLYTYLKSQKGFEGFGEGETAQFMDQFLKKSDPNYQASSSIKWNFTKFLVNREGKVVARFEPTIEMSSVREAVAKLI